MQHLMIVTLPSRVLAIGLPLLVAAFAAGGCGSEENAGKSQATPRATTAAGGEDRQPLEHVEGTITSGGDDLVVTPAAGGEPVTLAAGPQLQPAELKALAASGERVRVFYEAGGDRRAVRVERVVSDPAAATVAGLITKVSGAALTLQPNDGGEPVRLVIRPQNAEAFDIHHLEEHQEERSPIKVSYESANGTYYALSYQDA